MKNLPTMKETKGFLQDNKKTIFGTAFALVLLYALAIAYTLFSDDKVEEIKEIDPATGLELQLITDTEYEALLEDAVRFDFYVENTEGYAFTNFNLLEAVLLSPQVYEAINSFEPIASTDEIEAMEEGDIPANYMIDVDTDYDTSELHITVGTGDEAKNEAIATVLYEAMQEGTIPFFENKSIYLLSEPHVVQLEKGPEQTDETGSTSLLLYLVMGAGLFIGGLLLGMLLGFFRLFFKKEITDVFNYRMSDDDTVLDLSRTTAADQETALVHGIQHPAATRKLILSEEPFAPTVQKRLEQLEGTPYVFAQSVLSADPLLSFDEVIFVSRKNGTTKDWYKNQRTLLENYATPIKIILV
ncbi:hypothetical protein [Trichococcus alkaliphilus]|uniref:hypothetical protein n=1 Tax=Trichococcus alkaliphilus TaxID=2052943 RepID=UPI000D0B8CD8|nr:hypothetical protein [Trichococcus alkaliphilus]